METIQTSTVLSLGSNCLGNHPDALVRRLVLAQLLVTNRAVASVEAGVLAFKLWATPQSREHPVETILAIANERARKANDSLLHV